RTSTICSVIFLHLPPPTQIYTLSLHDALPISWNSVSSRSGWTTSSTWLTSCSRTADRNRLRSFPDVVTAAAQVFRPAALKLPARSEEHTSELQSLAYLVCRLLLEKKKR